MIVRLIIFLLINFSALALGGFFTGDGVTSDWYYELNKAPWTPPGWVFGAAWTSIMVFFSIYLSAIWENTKSRKKLIYSFSVQWILNVIWNPIFFYFHQPLIGFITIILLTLMVIYISIEFHKKDSYLFMFMVPYVLWLIIATSLNAYILITN